MNLHTFFSISIENIIHFTPQEAVIFFRKLLWAEANRVGINGYLISVPDCINVGDGGVDAFIEDAEPRIDEIIPLGCTGFQIKASDLQPEKCKKELHVGGKKDQPLKPEIRRILDLGGNYVLVVFADISSDKQQRRINSIKEELDRLNYHNDVRLYTASQLVEFTNKHIALVNELKRIDHCVPFSKWANQKFIQTPASFIIDEQREEWMLNTRRQLADIHDQTQIHRVTGLSGIGKTRLVYETLNIEGIKQSVVYVNADYFLSSDLFWRFQNDTMLHAVLVVDECNKKQHDEIVRAFAGPRRGLTIITISSDKGLMPSPTRLIDLQPLDPKRIRELIDIEFPSLLHEVASRLTQFADGFPRIAVLLGESYLENGFSKDEVIRITDSVLMDRLLGVSTPLTTHDRYKIRILQTISIFGKIGYEGRVSNESEWLADFVGVTLVELKEIIREQKERGIIQGHYFLYVSPLMLQIHLLSEWWETHGFDSEEQFNNFFGAIPEEFRMDLLDRFLGQLPYSGATDQGKEFAESIMRSDLFNEDNGKFLKTEIGSRFFLNLSESNLNAALTLLENTIGTWNGTEINNFRIGRRNIVWVLEKMVSYERTFIRGTRILLQLAENENEPYANNATGVFCSLFTPVSGKLSLTEAPPSMRLPILRGAVESSKFEIRKIGIEACNKGLETRFFSRTIENPLANLRREPSRWTAKTYGEIFNVYREIWNLLVNVVKKPQSQDEQIIAFEILVNRSVELSHISNLSDMVISTFEDLKKLENLKKAMLEATVRFLRYKNTNIDKEIVERWITLKNELTGTSYVDLIHRFVGINIFEDQYDKDGNPTKLLEVELQKLAKYSLNHENEFRSQIGWLLSEEAVNSQYFGYLLAKEDKELKLIHLLLNTLEDLQDKVNLALIGGYLQALHEKNLQKWEYQIEEISKNNKLLPYFTEIITRSGITDKVINLLIWLVLDGQIPSATLGVLSSSREIRDLSEKTFLDLIDLILREDVPNNFEIAIRNMYVYFIFERNKSNLPDDFTFSLLTLPYTEENADYQNKVMVDYYWREISTVFLSQYPEKQINFLDILLNYYSKEIGLSTLPQSQPNGIMNQILQKEPEESWNLITQILDSENVVWKHSISQWLRGDKWNFGREDATVPITFIPYKLIWKWVNSDISRNAVIISRMVPNELFLSQDEKCLAREILVKYGENEDVCEALLANFFTESWSGPASLYYQKKKNDLLKFRKSETNKNVLRWIDKYIASLDSSLKNALLREERRGY